MYSFSSTVRYSECDSNSRLTIPALVNYLQDCSTFQTESLGHGVRYLAEHHFAWFIMAWQIFVDRMPCYCEPIVVSTWCPTGGATNMHRNFTIADEQGNAIVRADSLWVAFDTERMGPIRMPEGEEIYLTGEPAVDLPPLQRKIKLASEGEPQSPLTISEQNLDTNHHVNNSQYLIMADHIVRAQDEDFDLARLYVQYKKSAQLGDVIVPRLHVEKGGYAIDLADEAGASFAIVRMERRES